MANEKSNEKESRLLNKYFHKGTSIKEKNSQKKNVKEQSNHIDVGTGKSYNDGSKRKLDLFPFRNRKMQKESMKLAGRNKKHETMKTSASPINSNGKNYKNGDEYQFPNINNEIYKDNFLNTPNIYQNLNITTNSNCFEIGHYDSSNNIPNYSFEKNATIVKNNKVDFNSTNATPSTFAGNVNKNHSESYINHGSKGNGSNQNKPEVIFSNTPNKMWNTNFSSFSNVSYYTNGSSANIPNYMELSDRNDFSYLGNGKSRMNDKKQKKNTYLVFDQSLMDTEHSGKKKTPMINVRYGSYLTKKVEDVCEHGQVKYAYADKELPYRGSNEMKKADIYQEVNTIDPHFLNRKKYTVSTPQESTSNTEEKEFYSFKDYELDKANMLKNIYSTNNKNDNTNSQNDLNATNGTDEVNNFVNVINGHTHIGNENKNINSLNGTSVEKLSYKNYENTPIRGVKETNKNILQTTKPIDIIEYTYDFERNTQPKISSPVNSKKKKAINIVVDNEGFSQGYKKRGSFNYSGLLTSMVSSILTQQNDIKIEENINNKGNIHKGSMNYYHRTANYNNLINSNYKKVDIGDVNANRSYEYTLLHHISGHEQKDKVEYQTTPRELGKNSEDKLLVLTLIIMIFISILCNYDHGAIPVTLGEIQKDFPLSYIEQSLLGSLVYFGLIIGTVIAGVLFELLPAKMLVAVSIISLSVSLYIFSHANCIIFMYISRFVNGLCQAIPVVYLPVWVDEFSPDEKATQWMSYIQLASIGGTVFGYFLGGILSNTDCSNSKGDNFLFPISFLSTWRSPFLIQAFLLIPIFLTLIFIPSDKINITTNYSDLGESSDGDMSELQNREDLIKMHKPGESIQKKKNSNGNRNTHQYSLIMGGSTDGKSYEGTKYINYEKTLNKKEMLQELKNNKSRIHFNRSATYIMEKKTNVLKKTLKEVKKLLKNKLYIIITLGMSNLYFVVTGIQFWITEYMSVVLLTEKIKIVTVSTLCFLTSPTSGVWFGGYICDFFGGYKNTNYSKTIKVATAFAVSACIFGILSAHLNNFVLFSVCLWLCLFNGSALVPVAVGMLLSCVDNHQKSLSSAVSQIIYNIFGWFSAPLLSGALMDIMHKYTHDNRLALKTGFTMVLYSSAIGFILLLYANFIDLSDKKVSDDANEMVEPLKS